MHTTSLHRLAEKAVELMLPEHCGLCGCETRDRPLCPGCFRDLPWIARACERCGTPLALALPPGVPCGACQQRTPPFATAFAPLHYAFPIDAVIKAFKFGRRQSLAPLLAETALPWLGRHAARFDGLVPVPLHRRRHALRGFNQAHELARELCRASGLPIRSCLRRRRHTAPQSGLDSNARRQNVRGAFRVVGTLCMRHALVIDDVMTTGETCRAVSMALLSAGVEQVSVLTIARASPTPSPSL